MAVACAWAFWVLLAVFAMTTGLNWLGVASGVVGFALIVLGHAFSESDLLELRPHSWGVAGVRGGSACYLSHFEGADARLVAVTSDGDRIYVELGDGATPEQVRELASICNDFRARHGPRPSEGDRA